MWGEKERESHLYSNPELIHQVSLFHGQSFLCVQWRHALLQHSVLEVALAATGTFIGTDRENGGFLADSDSVGRVTVLCKTVLAEPTYLLK